MRSCVDVGVATGKVRNISVGLKVRRYALYRAGKVRTSRVSVRARVGSSN